MPTTCLIPKSVQSNGVDRQSCYFVLRRVMEELAMVCWRQMCALGAALVLFPHVTHAADFAVKGMGMQSCASWTDARSKAQLGSETLLRLSWVLGFVSAENQRLSASAPKKAKAFDLAKGLDLPAIMAWLDKFCAEQPLKPIVAATQALVFEQAKEQGVLERR